MQAHWQPQVCTGNAFSVYLQPMTAYNRALRGDAAIIRKSNLIASMTHRCRTFNASGVVCVRALTTQLAGAHRHRINTRKVAVWIIHSCIKVYA
jgi:hypothetical protein